MIPALAAGHVLPIVRWMQSTKKTVNIISMRLNARIAAHALVHARQMQLQQSKNCQKQA